MANFTENKNSFFIEVKTCLFLLYTLFLVIKPLIMFLHVNSKVLLHILHNSAIKWYNNYLLVSADFKYHIKIAERLDKSWIKIDTTIYCHQNDFIGSLLHAYNNSKLEYLYYCKAFSRQSPSLIGFSITIK